jgi:O-antigen/teichoic acid export membrane protein
MQSPTPPDVQARRAFQAFQVMRYGALLLTGAAFAHGGLGTFGIGVYEGLVFLGSLLSFWWLSGITQSCLTTATLSTEGRSSDVFNVFVVLSVAGVLLLVLFRTLVTPFTFLTNKPDLLAFYTTYGWCLALITPVYLIEQMLLLRKEAVGLVAYGVIAFGSQLVLMAVPIFLGHGLEMALQGLLIATFGRYVLLWVLLARWAEFRIDTAYLFRFWAHAWPLAVGTLLAGSSEYIDGLIVSRYFDEETFATYRYGAKELPLSLILATAFSNSLVPAIVQRGLTSVMGEVRTSGRRLMHLFFAVGLVLMVSGPFIYPLVFNVDFSASVPVFCTYLLLIIPRSVFPQPLLIGAGHSKVVMTSSAIELTVNVGLSLLLLPFLGTTGIALGTVVAAFTDKVYSAIRLRSLCGVRPSDYTDVSIWAAWSAVLLAGYAGVMFTLT